MARPAVIMVKSDPTASVAVNLGRDNTVFVNPYNGQILGGQSATHDFMRDVVDWHRWLGTEGEGRATARAITGACNLAFFWLAVTGVYLWWPHSWQWRGLKHESADQYPLARQSARLELAQRHRILVFNGAGCAHADRGGHVLSLGK